MTSCAKTKLAYTDVIPGGIGLSRGKVNLLTLLGALFGIIALFSQWMVVHSVFWGEPLSPSSVVQSMVDIQQYPSARFTEIWLSLLVFFVGLIITFATPLGGLVQVSGIVMFVHEFLDIYSRWPGPNFEDVLTLGTGLFFGSLSAVLVISSLLYPIGVNFGRPISLRDRLLTIDPWRERTTSGKPDNGGAAAFLAIIGGLMAILYGVFAPGVTTSYVDGFLKVFSQVLVIAGLAAIAIAFYLLVGRNRRQTPRIE